MLENILDNLWRGTRIRKGSPSSAKLLGNSSPVDALVDEGTRKLESSKIQEVETVEDRARNVSATLGEYLLHAGAGTLELASRMGEKTLRSAVSATMDIAANTYHWGKGKLSEQGQARLDGLEAHVSEARDQVRSVTRSDTTTGKITRGLGHLGTVAASLAFALGVLNTSLHPTSNAGQTNTYSQRTDQESEAQLPVDDIGKFDDIEKILVYVENQDERQYVLDNVRHYRATEPHRQDLQIETGSIDTITDPSTDRTWHIVEEGEPIPDIAYDMIQPRGHTGDMPGLYRDALSAWSETHERNDDALRAVYKDIIETVTGDQTVDEHVFVYFGGCNSHQFVQNNAQANIALAGTVGIADGSHNNWAMLTLPQLLDEQESWEAAYDRLTELDEDMQDLVFPETDRYTTTHDHRYLGR